MPTYMYRCLNCNKEFEQKLSWEDKGKACCPECGKRDLKELFGRYTFNAGAQVSKNVPEKCQSCPNASPGCPMSH